MWLSNFAHKSPYETGKKMTNLLNVRVKQLSISQKWSFWCSYWGWFDTPQQLQNLVGMVHGGTKFCPQVPPMRQRKKLSHLLNVRVKQLSISKKWSFWCWYWGWYDTPKTWWGWFMWLPNFAQKSPP